MEAVTIYQKGNSLATEDFFGFFGFSSKIPVNPQGQELQENLNFSKKIR